MSIPDDLHFFSGFDPDALTSAQLQAAQEALDRYSDAIHGASEATESEDPDALSADELRICAAAGCDHDTYRMLRARRRAGKGI